MPIISLPITTFCNAIDTRTDDIVELYVIVGTLLVLMKQDESTQGIVNTTTGIKTTTSTRLLGIRFFSNCVVVYACALSCVCNDSFSLSIHIAIS